MVTETPSYRPHFERAPIGIFEVNEHGDYLDVNQFACEMVGYSRDELLELSVADLAPVQDDSEDIPSFAEVRETGEIRTEGVLRRKNGDKIEVLIEAVPLDGDRFVAYVHDISEQKAYEHQLEEQRDNLEILNQVLRHDVRNDLQLVTAYAGLLADRCENPEEKEFITKINNSADHAVELTETAREIADLMLSATTDPKRINLRSVLESEVSEVQSSYSNAAITFETQISAVTVHANDMLPSVFRNLLKNAIQHNNKPIAEVTVTATDHDETVIVRIADNGPGISDDQKEVIFGKGQRDLDSAGTGIGLYLVDTLVTSYNGTVWVEDNEPEGAVFNVELPKTQ